MTLSQATEGREYRSLIDLLRDRASRTPERIAYLFLDDGETESSLSFGQLEEQVRAVAARLQELGAADQRALLFYPPGLEFIVAFLGATFARVVAIPAYPPRNNQNLNRLRAIIEDAGATLVLTTTSLLANLEAQFERVPELRSIRWLATDDIAPGAHTSWREPQVDGDTLAFLQYTSGSTGMPKGVMVSHGNIIHNEHMIKVTFGHGDWTVFAGWLPVFHDMGLIGNVLQPLYLGVKSVLMPPAAFIQKPARWLHAISRYRATTSGGPNFAYDLCVRKVSPEQREGLDLSSWQVAFNGAEPVRAETVRRFLSTYQPHGLRPSAFYPCYGMAETTLLISGGVPADRPIIHSLQAAALEQGLVVEMPGESQGSRALVACGRSWLEKVRIVDPHSLTLCPEDRVGEIWVSSRSVAQGYWNQPELTEVSFRAQIKDTGEGPFLRTGDLGFLREGEVFVTGRLKDLIIIRGLNHYPQDIEQTVEQCHPALRASGGAAFAIDVEDEERLVIVHEVERSFLHGLDVEEVVGNIRQAVAQEHGLQVYAVQLLKTNRVPKTSSGKLQRHACRAGFLDKSLSVVGEWVELHQAEPTPEPLPQEPQALYTKEILQSWLLGRMSDYLGVKPDDIDTGQPFERYGLDSAVAVTLTGELAEWLGLKFDPTLFWEHPSVDGLVGHLLLELGSAQPR